MAKPDITTLTPQAFADHEMALAELLRDCVAAGASVNFVMPFSLDDSLAYWRDKVAPAIHAGHRDVLTAHLDGRLAGTVQLDCGTPPNQPHRADVSKLLVHPTFRRRGIARALMAALEANASRRERRLLTLDTAADDAEALYRSLGYQRTGVIPGYALDAAGACLLDTVVMYKTL